MLYADDAICGRCYILYGMWKTDSAKVMYVPIVAYSFFLSLRWGVSHFFCKVRRMIVIGQCAYGNEFDGPCHGRTDWHLQLYNVQYKHEIQISKICQMFERTFRLGKYDNSRRLSVLSTLSPYMCN